MLIFRASPTSVNFNPESQSMTAFTITVQDQEVKALLQKLQSKTQNMGPVLRTLGEQITERSKARFATSSAPDGTPWKPNSAATLVMLGERLLGHRNKKGARSYVYSKQGGLLNGKGLDRMVNKKPLIGESGDLRRQIVWNVSGNDLTVSATMAYSAIQQFGGKAGRGHKVTIPARPYLPIRPDGTLYPQEQTLVLAAINDFLNNRDI